MGIRLVAGRAGSGKTRWCQSEICRELERSLTDGPRLILLVPEQAGLQMERGLLALSATRVLGRCEVLSFRRLARRILNESVGPAPVPLTPLGRQMALRHLIGRQRRLLKEFAKVAERSGFVSEISRGVSELLQEGVGADQLDACAQDAADAGDATAARLHDVALLYRAYLDYLGDARVDPEAVLDLARARLANADWLRGARIWIDGFAGLTGQQVRMVAALAKCASHVDVALLLDPRRGVAADSDGPVDDLSLFARTEQTWATVVRSCVEAGVEIEKPVKLSGRDGSRFDEAESLAVLERRLFSVAPISEALESTPAENGVEVGSRDECPVRLVRARDRRAEVKAVIRAIVDLVHRPGDPMRYRDVAIVVRDLTPYHDLISAGLKSHGIPFFVDRRRPTFHHPLVQAVRAALAMVGGGRFDEAIDLLIKSGLSGLSDESADGVENYCLAYGLWTPGAWDAPWTRPVVPQATGGSPSAWMTDALDALEASRRFLRERLGDWWPTSVRGGRPKCRTWVGRLYRLLERLNAAEQLAKWCEAAGERGDLDEAEEHEQVWSDLMKLLDELATALGDEQMTGRRFREVMESGLSEFTLGLVPATLDQVLVGSVERSRHPAVRAVFVLGFADGQFPARIEEETILGERERAYLEERNVGLGRTRAQRVLDERMLAYVAVTRPSRFLWVSCPESDEAGKEISPSPYWLALQAALPDVAVETVETDHPGAISSAGDLASGVGLHLREWAGDRLDDDAAAVWLGLYQWLRSTESAALREVAAGAMAALRPSGEARLTNAAAAALWPAPYKTSVSRLETLAWCPFRHYAMYGLRLRERRKNELSGLELGSLYHRMLEQFVNELIETGATLQEMPRAEIARRLNDICEHVVPEFADDLNLDERERNSIRWRTDYELPASVEGQQSTVGRTPLSPAMVEGVFGDDPGNALPALQVETSRGETVLVRGKIDRVDLLQAGDARLAVVFDYKRSIGRRLALDEVYHGLALQLLTYLLVIRDRFGPKDGARIIPGGAFYLPLLGGFKRLDHPSDAEEASFTSFDCFKPRGVIDFDWIDELDPGLESKWSEVYAVYRKGDGGPGHLDSTDAVDSRAMAGLLAHVRAKLTELAEAWIGGEIEVRPARLGRSLPCSYCQYRGVCRFEYAADRVRPLRKMKRSAILAELAAGSDEAGEADG